MFNPMHSERPKLYTILAFLSAIGLTCKVPKMKKVEFANSVDLDEVAYCEPPHLGLHSS